VNHTVQTELVGADDQVIYYLQQTMTFRSLGAIRAVLGSKRVALNHIKRYEL
jgi:hypothetical protein